MELSCPTCQKKLNIPDQFAGQLMRCPLCNATFQAPALAPGQSPTPATAAEPAMMEPMVIPEPPPPPREAYRSEPSRSPAMRAEEMVYATEAAVPAVPPRDYIRCCTLHFPLRIVTWIAPAALLLVLIFSFLPWGPSGPNAWTIGFGSGAFRGDALIAIFDIFMLLALIAAIPSALIAINVIPIPPGFRLWRAVALAALVGLTFLFFFIRYIDYTFSAAALTIWPKLVWRLMFLATLTSVMEIWLELRRAKTLPPPKVEFYR
jgi:hypothetical protein